MLYEREADLYSNTSILGYVFYIGKRSIAHTGLFSLRDLKLNPNISLKTLDRLMGLGFSHLRMSRPAPERQKDGPVEGEVPPHLFFDHARQFNGAMAAKLMITKNRFMPALRGPLCLRKTAVSRQTPAAEAQRSREKGSRGGAPIHFSMMDSTQYGIKRTSAAAMTSAAGTRSGSASAPGPARRRRAGCSLEQNKIPSGTA